MEIIKIRKPVSEQSAAFAYVSLINIGIFLLLLILLPKNDGKFGSGIFIGLPNHLWVLACYAWMITSASGILKKKATKN